MFALVALFFGGQRPAEINDRVDCAEIIINRRHGARRLNKIFVAKICTIPHPAPGVGRADVVGIETGEALLAKNLAEQRSAVVIGEIVF